MKKKPGLAEMAAELIDLALVQVKRTAREAVLAALSDNGAMTVKQITAMVTYSESRVASKLKELVQAGLAGEGHAKVNGRRTTVYWLVAGGVRKP